jgi:hypothetical protein
MNAAPISLSAFRWRALPVPASSHRTTVLAPISISESSPKPARAIERADSAATASTTMPTTFHPSVTPSSSRPRAATSSRRSCAGIAPLHRTR